MILQVILLCFHCFLCFKTCRLYLGVHAFNGSHAEVDQKESDGVESNDHAQEEVKYTLNVNNISMSGLEMDDLYRYIL